MTDGATIIAGLLGALLGLLLGTLIRRRNRADIEDIIRRYARMERDLLERREELHRRALGHAPYLHEAARLLEYDRAGRHEAMALVGRLRALARDITEGTLP